MSQRTDAYLKAHMLAGDPLLKSALDDLIDSKINVADVLDFIAGQYVTYNLADPLWGGVADGKRVADAAIAAGSNVVHSLTAGWTEADEGKVIGIWGAGTHLDTTGAGLPPAPGYVLYGTITNVTAPNEATLSATAVTAVTNAPAAWGTSNSDAMTAILAAITASGVGGRILIPHGVWIFDEGILAQSNIIFQGEGMGATELIEVEDNSLFSAVSGVSLRNVIYMDMRLVNLGAGWNGNNRAISTPSTVVNYNLVILRCEFLSDSRNMSFYAQTGWILYNHCAPLTDGFCGINVDAAFGGDDSFSRNITVAGNVIEAVGVGRTDRYMNPGVVTDPVNTWITGQAPINVRASYVKVYNNLVLGTGYVGLLFEGDGRSYCEAHHNYIAVTPGYPLSGINGVAGISCQAQLGIKLHHNIIIGSAASKAPAGGASGVGIAIIPSSPNTPKIIPDLCECTDNFVVSFKYGIKIGDTSSDDCTIGKWHIERNHIRDSGTFHVFVETHEMIETGSIGFLCNNVFELTAVASNITTQLSIGSGMTLYLRDNTFINSNDGFSLTTGAGSTIYTSRNSNNTATKMWNTTQLKAYLGTLIVEDRIRLQTGVPIDLSQVVGSQVIYLGPLTQRARYIIVGLDFTYTEVMSADTSIALVVKAGNSQTLLTYTPVLSTAAGIVVSKFQNDMTDLDITNTLKTITVTNPGAKTGTGEVLVTAYIMPNC